MPSTSTDVPILLCKEDYLRRVFADDSEVTGEYRSNDTCGGCGRPVIVGLPLQVDPNGDGHMEGWHHYCWKVYKTWNIKLDTTKPPSICLMDFESFDAECLLWEDRVQTAFGSLSEFGAVLEQRRGMLVQLLQEGRHGEAINLGKEVWAQVEYLINISENNVEGIRYAYTPELYEAKSSFDIWVARTELYMEDCRQMAEKTISLLTSVNNSIQDLLKKAFVWFIQQDLHGGKIDPHLLRLELLIQSSRRSPFAAIERVKIIGSPACSAVPAITNDHWMDNLERIFTEFGVSTEAIVGCDEHSAPAVYLAEIVPKPGRTTTI
ncbi:hypothetical protein SpCBS45565_g00724 [Spizellomyces sp. 'palustris']|nr:hypothetical protein SpCBS45565_g00724 [Spizellomyces sp. 'palustris']